MHGDYIERKQQEAVLKALKRAPVVCILGPRQCGKSTLAKTLLNKIDSIYLDLQRASDRAQLNEPNLFFDANRNKLICLDEIQQLPDFFSHLRSEVDLNRTPGRFLILGSASRDLLKQSSETLAGRITYLELTPLNLTELSWKTFQTHWNRGGFPESYLSESDGDSYLWREDFIKTFISRDIPMYGVDAPPTTLERFLKLVSHFHGSTPNISQLADSAGLSRPTAKKYIDLLNDTYVLRHLSSYEKNFGKRLIKEPRVYYRDSGIFHFMQGIETYNELLGSSCLGVSWEGYCLENILSNLPKWTASYIRTSNGAEVDLILEYKGRIIFCEFKASKTPKVKRGFYNIADELNPSESWIIAPVEDSYPFQKGIYVGNPVHFLNKFA